jgi:ABC-type transport system involved in cytochrome c biogenesis permease subunit
MVGLGFPWMTLGMLTGAIWARTAWGRYWDWDPKESWTLITWLTYLIFLHGRALRGWRGRRIAWLAVLGLGAVAFTFLGVGWLVRSLRLESIHIF